MMEIFKIFVDNKAKDVLSVSGFEPCFEHLEKNKYCFHFIKPEDDQTWYEFIDLLKKEGKIHEIEELKVPDTQALNQI